jgi:hypothetical protein
MEPDSLCARVLQARYFPSSDLLNAKLKREAPSHGKVYGLVFKI